MKYFKYLDLEYKNVADKLLAYIYDNADTILYSHNYAWNYAVNKFQHLFR